MKHLALFLSSSLSFSAFAAPELSGKYMSSCNWDVYPATASRAFISFTGNQFERTGEYYSDYLCLHKIENPTFGNDPVTKGTFTIGEAVPIMVYGPNKDSAYKITLSNLKDYYEDNTVKSIEGSTDSCFYLGTGFENNVVLYLGTVWDETKEMPCDATENYLVKVTQ